MKIIKNLFSIKLFWFIRGLIYKCFFGKFGNLSYIGKPTLIINPKKFFIGNKVRIFPCARLEAHGSFPVLIEDNVSIGHNLHLSAYNKIIIGSGTTVASNVLIMSLVHNVVVKDIPYMDQPIKGKETIIGKNCLIGSNSCIMAGVTLGDQCIVASNSVVTKSFDSHQVIAGNPAQVLKKLF
jgi:acetyltransferase-like isoleucine patch superfamily enzyme|tara:strand:+ start:1621 stop:2163 length:543 start_codon:yes stop_codon:yes gene_type:complete